MTNKIEILTLDVRIEYIKMIDLNFSNAIEKYRLDPKDFEIDKKREMAEGGYGIVSFQIQKSTKIKCAVKKTKECLRNNESAQRSFKREVEILATSHHPAIVPFIGFSIDDFGYGYIYLYEIENGSLESYLSNRSKGYRDPHFDDNKKFIISYGVALAMQYLHSLNRIHRDLKTANILIDNEFRPYVTDFGTAKEIDPSVPINQTLAETTPAIMAPEFLEDPSFYSNSLPIDVYAYGITLYRIWTEISPFCNLRTILKVYNEVISGGRPKIPNTLPEKWKKLITSCWAHNPLKRPSFKDIINIYESSDFLTDDTDKRMLKDYKNYIKHSHIEAQIESKRPSILHSSSFTESPVLAKMREEAKSGDHVSQYNYIVTQFEGEYGEPDYDEIIDFSIEYASRPSAFDKEHIRDTATIEYYAGVAYAIKENYKLAENMLKRAINHGNGDASFELAELMYYNLIKFKSTKEIEFYYKRGADAGNPDSLKKYAFLTYYGKLNDRPDRKRAIEYFKKGSDNGDAELMYLWAIRNEYGRDIPKNPDEAIRLIKLSAELGYSPAMVDYGIHALNGINIPKDEDLAFELFKRAAEENKYPEALLWYSVMLKRKNIAGEDYDSLTYLKRCINTKEVPDAWAVYGRLLVDEGKIDEALPNLNRAAQNGSIDAFLCLGELCEKDPSMGDAHFYFELASNHCHCLDTYGFFTPISYKVFHCNDCNIDICEGCAKHCHRDHDIKLSGEQSGLKCSCGKEGFSGHCTAEFVGECRGYQHLYQCATCCMKSDEEFICKSCAETCHKGHEVTDCGIQQNFCSCGMHRIPHNFRCHLLSFQKMERPYTKCSNESDADNKIRQRWFQCVTCGSCGSFDKGVCKACSSICHSGHIVLDLGVREQCCCCKQNKCSFTKKKDD